MTEDEEVTINTYMPMNVVPRDPNNNLTQINVEMI
jgi:hypothetical protein